MIKVLINDSSQRDQKIIKKSLGKEGYKVLKEKISESNIRQILQKLRPAVLLPITIEDFKLFSKINERYFETRYKNFNCRLQHMVSILQFVIMSHLKKMSCYSMKKWRNLLLIV